MDYLPEPDKVIYRAKSGRDQRTYGSLEWLAAMMSLLPLKGEQLVKYYGHYSNRARGESLKAHLHSSGVGHGGAPHKPIQMVFSRYLES